MIFRRRQRGAPDGSATARPAPPPAASDSEQIELIAEVEALTRRNRARRDPALERRVLRLRHRAGASALARPPAAPRYAEPDFDRLPDGAALPELSLEELTPEVLRAGILRQGCVLVRGLLDRAEAGRFAGEIGHAFEARERQDGSSGDDYYEEFEPDPPYPGVIGRPWVADAGGVWAADSPKLMFELMEAFERAGLRSLIGRYLGETAALSVDKCTLRRVDPATTVGAWHQDGKFLGDVRSLNVWLTLSRCGADAPGLDIVPRRVDHVLATGGEGVPTAEDGTRLDWGVAPPLAERVAGGADRILRPLFEPGDALLFDHLFLHQTASDPRMPNARFAIESWFFGASRFPQGYVPIAF